MYPIIKKRKTLWIFKISFIVFKINSDKFMSLSMKDMEYVSIIQKLFYVSFHDV